MMRLREDKDAISSVISVVLMIAIAVIIAAVIASLVLGVTSDIPDAKVVAVKARVSPLTEEMASLYKHLYRGSPDPTSQYLVVTLYSDLDGTGASSRDDGVIRVQDGTIKTEVTTDPRAGITIPSITNEPKPSLTTAPTPTMDLTLMVNGTYAGGASGLNVGKSLISKFPVIPGDCHAIVVARFKDGSEQIILNRHF